MNGIRVLVCTALLLTAGIAKAELYYLIVNGLGGNPLYEESFAGSTAEMASAAERTLGDDARVTVLSGDNATREAVRAAMTELSTRLKRTDRLAVFLIGHGNHDGREYKFNLTGPDLDATEFRALLDAVPATSQLVVNASSSSGPVLEAWESDGRIVIAATRSGRERNVTRFAEQWATALSADEADLDKNGSISAQEAFDFAARLVADSYEVDGTLATEHPELRGGVPTAFEVSRLGSRASVSAEVDALYDRLDELTEQVAALRSRREELGDVYQDRMLDLQVEIALVQQQIDDAVAER